MQSARIINISHIYLPPFFINLLLRRRRCVQCKLRSLVSLPFWYIVYSIVQGRVEFSPQLSHTSNNKCRSSCLTPAKTNSSWSRKRHIRLLPCPAPSALPDSRGLYAPSSSPFSTLKVICYTTDVAARRKSEHCLEKNKYDKTTLEKI